MRIKIKGFTAEIKTAFIVVLLIMIALGLIEQFFIVLLSVTIHETAHILMAGIWGLKTERVIVTPIGETAVIKGIENIHIIKKLLIVMIGPLTSILIGLLTDGIISDINKIIGLFNLIPIYPLDGGRILQYTLSYFIGVLRANRVTSRVSCTISYLVFGVGIIYLVLYYMNIGLLCVGIYLIKINKREYLNMTYIFYKSIMRKKDDRILPIRGLRVNNTMSVKAIIYRLGWDYYTLVYVRGIDGNYNVIEEERIVGYALENGSNEAVGNIDTVNKKNQKCVK